MKKIKIIAFTADSQVFENDRLFDQKWMLKFPGASWFPILASNLKDYKVTTTDVALSHVESGYWEASSIGVIQHLDHSDPIKLISLGANPLLLIAAESPVYAVSFFNNITSIAKDFPKRVLLEVLIDQLPIEENKNYVLKFPSFFNKNIITPVEWENKYFMTMVVRNMYNDSLSLNYLKHPLDILIFVYRWLRTKTSRSFILKSNFPYENLHNKRIEAIIFFGKKNKLDLFGFGWDNIKNLPRYYQNKLLPVLKKIKPTPIDNKLTTISQYKFALCFENAAYKGGVSEKIIDCFVAGVIPVYLGAVNIKEFVPEDTFIDVRLFNTWEELYIKLEDFSEIDANMMISKGREFIMSEKGQVHSYDGFAKFIGNLISQILK